MSKSTDIHDLLDEVDIDFYGEHRQLKEEEKQAVRDMVHIMRSRRSELEHNEK